MYVHFWKPRLDRHLEQTAPPFVHHCSKCLLKLNLLTNSVKICSPFDAFCNAEHRYMGNGQTNQHTKTSNILNGFVLNLTIGLKLKKNTTQFKEDNILVFTITFYSIDTNNRLIDTKPIANNKALNYLNLNPALGLK